METKGNFSKIMNKTIKIVLLVVATILAVGGVMIFYKTIVSPPGKLEFKNQYVQSAKNDIAAITSANSIAEFDSVFVAITHELEFQYSGSLLSSNEKNELLDDFAKQYVEAYVQMCDSKFSKSTWNENEMGAISSQISKLQSLKNTDGANVIRGDLNASLNEVSNVVRDYFAAKKVAIVSGYHGLQSAKRKIADSKRYLNTYPINNCSELVSRLQSLPSRLEQAHYNYLESQVEKLRYFGNSYQDRQFMYELFDEIKEYKQGAFSVYGTNRSLDELEERANRYYSELDKGRF